MKELALKGMKIDTTSDVLKRELKVIGEQMTGDWIKLAGDEGRAIVDLYNKK